MGRGLAGVLVLTLLSGCTGISAARRAAWEADATPALTALQAANFELARTEADRALERDAENSRAAAVSALALYREAVGDFAKDALTLVASAAAASRFRTDLVNQDFLDFMLDRAEQRLSAIDARLATAAKDPQFSLELCPACWVADWNRSGEVDTFDERLFEVELDANGEEIPPGDPRRRPTFRFDVADVAWLRAMLHFQRAALSFAGAYDVNSSWSSRKQDEFRIHVRDPAKLLKARDLALVGLSFAATCRQLVLAETDDDREWLPNPRQKNFALPLPVDDALFETWAGVLRDVEKLLTSEEGIDLAQLARTAERKWETPPGGFLDVGAIFTQPRDIVFREEELRRLKRDDPGGLSEFLGQKLGPAYKAKMTPSPLVGRLERMRKEVDRGEESFARKLRYLFWLN